MLQIYPVVDVNPRDYLPLPEDISVGQAVFWQGIHICGAATTAENEVILFDLPVCEASIRPAAYHTVTRQLYPDNTKRFDWYTGILKEMADHPEAKAIELTVIKKGRKEYKKIVILNTVDAWYGHSLIYLFHLHRLVKNIPEDVGIVILLQPFIEWLVPDEGVAEVWKVGISPQEAKKFYPSLSTQINTELKRFDEVFLSETPVLTDNISVSSFTKIPAFPEDRFGQSGNRFTFIWREDINRLWIRNYYLYGILRKLKLKGMLLPFQWLRVHWLFRQLRKTWGNDVRFTIAGMGRYGKFPSWIKDERVLQFDEATERKLCRIYAESEIVIGIHGSSMILPSAHAGMTVSLMPPKRWGNFAEDIIFNGEKTFTCLFRKRILPLNMPLSELRDVCIHMKDGMPAFDQKLAGTYGNVL